MFSRAFSSATENSISRTDSAMTSVSDVGSRELIATHEGGFIRVSAGLYLHESGPASSAREAGSTFVKVANELTDVPAMGISLSVDDKGDWTISHVQQNGAAYNSSARLLPGDIIAHVEVRAVSYGS